MSFFRTIVLSTAGMLLIATCSSAPSLEQACGDYASLFRQRQTVCHGVTPDPNKETLISRETQSCVLSSGAPGSQVGVSYWEQCAALVSNFCAGYMCATYPPGTRQMGEPCLAGPQCASLRCKGTVVVGTGGTALPNGIRCGTCAPRLTDGSPCDVATDVCDVGLSCFGGVCRQQGLAGAPCAVWADCAFPVVCKSNGFCGRVNVDGTPCGSGSDCGNDTGCDVATKLCTPAEYGAPGVACDAEVHRCRAGTCNTTTGVCPTVLSDGSACDPSDPSKVCDDYARCFGGTCRIPDPATCK
jgi:hypothetical protein